MEFLILERKNNFQKATFSQELFNYLASQSFKSQRPWLRLFHKRRMRSNLDIYVCSTHNLKRIQCYFSYFQHDEDARGRDDGTMEGWMVVDYKFLFGFDQKQWCTIIRNGQSSWTVLCIRFYSNIISRCICIRDILQKNSSWQSTYLYKSTEGNI